MDGATLFHANYFFVDVIGLSNPDMSTKTQLKKLDVLHDCIRRCPVFANTPSDQFRKLPTGDGMCLAFLQGIDLPLQLAIQLHEQLAEYNKGKISSELVQIRIGLHSGNCFTFTDILGNSNIWGPGIILARRVMDLGDAGHILLTPRIAEDLRELSDSYRKLVLPVRDYTIKHGTTMLIYSAYGNDFGNSTPPKKDVYQQSKLAKEIQHLQNTTLYPSIHVSLKLLNSDSMLVHHKRTYVVKNISSEPIEYVLHGIATDVEKSTINDLNLNMYDSNNKEMKLSSINLDEPYCKEFTTKFLEPIPGQAQSAYTLEYDIEEPERFFENNFAIDCNRFILEFASSDSAIMPKLFDVDQENDKKSQSSLAPTLTEVDNFKTYSWDFSSLTKGQTIRVEW